MYRFFVAAVVCLALAVSALHVPGSPAAVAVESAPSAPDPVTPTPSFRVVEAAGATTVNTDIVGDTVWGPQGSPYRVTQTVIVHRQASLTLLPGTVVEMSPNVSLLVSGQLMSLGEPERRVTVTGDAWGRISFSGSSQSQAEQSVIDYTDVLGGGGEPNGSCGGSGAVQSTGTGRLSISNSRIVGSRTSAVRLAFADEAGSYVGVHNNVLEGQICSLHVALGWADAVGNTLKGQVFYQLGRGRFWHNDSRGSATFAGSAVDVKFNSLFRIDHGGTWDQATQDMRYNYWAQNGGAVTPMPCLLNSDEARDWRPPIQTVYCDPAKGDIIPPGSPGLRHKTVGHVVDVRPWLEAPPRARIPEALTEPFEAAYGAVNTYRGTVSYTAEDLAINDLGMPINATRTYGVKAGSAAGSATWRTSFTERLTDSRLDLTDSSDPVPLPPCLGGGGTEVREPGMAAECQQADGTTSVLTPDRKRYRFDVESGRLLSVELGASGHVLTVDHEDDQLSRVTGTSGRFFQYERDGAGRILRVEDNAGRSVSYAYDDQGRLASVQGVDGKAETYEYGSDGLTRVTSAMGVTRLAVGYDGAHRVAWVEEDGRGRTSIEYLDGRRRLTRADGSVVEQILDDSGRVVSTSVDGGASTRHIYDGDGRMIATILGVPRSPMTGYAPPSSFRQFDSRGDLIATVDGLGRVTRMRYDAAHRPLQRTEPDGGVTTMSYDGAGNLASVRDPRDKTWLVESNARGQVTSVTDPLGAVQAVTYEPDGDVAARGNGVGGVSRFESSDEGWQTASITPSGDRTDVEYTPWGEVRLTTRPRGGEERTVFDADRRMVSRSDALGRTSTFGYDFQGRLLEVSGPTETSLRLSYDELGRPTGITTPDERVYRRSYTAEGWPRTITSPDGSESTLRYDPAGRVVGVVDPLGRQTQTVYDRAGQVVRTDHPDGSSESYAYDAAGRQVRYTDGAGAVFTSTYDLGGNQLSLTDPLGKVERREFDAIGRLSKVTDVLARVVDIAYPDNGQSVRVTDSLGLRSASTFDASGRLSTEQDGEGNLTRYSYDADGNTTSVLLPGERAYTMGYDLAGQLVERTDPRDKTTGYAYDTSGRRTAEVFPDGTRNTWSYDQLGNITRQTNRNGDAWRFAYDELSRQTQATDPLGAVTNLTYDDADQVVRVEQPGSAAVTIAYDPMGRPAVMSHDDGRFATRSYDKVGNLIAEKDPLGRATTYVYDKLHRLTKTQYPGVMSELVHTYDAAGNLLSQFQYDKAWQRSYDARDRVKTATDPLGKATTYAYDLADRLVSTTAPSGLNTTYAYDASGQLAATTDPGGATSRYDHLPTGELSKVVQPSGATWRFAYDEAGHLASQTDPLNQVTRFEHDPEGRLLRTTKPSGATIASTYDPLGRELTRTAAGVTRAYAYDLAGRLTAASAGTAAPTERFGYDARGSLTSSTTADRTTEYSYDAAGQPTGMRNPGGAELTSTFNAVGDVSTVRGRVNFDYSYNANGWPTRRTRPGSTVDSTTQWGYDKAGRPTSTNQYPYVSNATYDQDGRVTSTNVGVVDAATLPNQGTVAYTRDASGRLTGAERKTSTGVLKQTDTFAWDVDGNRTRVTRQPAGQPAVTTDAEYDAAGRLTRTVTGGEATSYDYDEDGQLVGVDGPGANDTTYEYDGFGEITGATVGSATGSKTVDYAHDAFGRVTARAETNGATSSTTGYGYAGFSEDPTSITTSAGRTDLLRDPQGELLSAVGPGGVVSHAVENPRGDLTGWRSDTKAALTSYSSYDAFGGVTRAAGTGTGPGVDLPLGYQGDVTDAVTGLVDMEARAYDPVTSRFTTQDVVVGDLGLPVSLNRYGYANANPADYVDPDGRSAVALGIGIWLSLCALHTDAMAFAWSTAVGLLDRAADSAMANFRGLTQEQIQQGFHEFATYAGWVPIIGDAINVVDALVYLSQGDTALAALSLAAAIPFIGDLAKVFRPVLNGIGQGLHLLGRTGATWIRNALGDVGSRAGAALSTSLGRSGQAIVDGIASGLGRLGTRSGSGGAAARAANGRATMSGGSGGPAVLHHPGRSVQIGRDPDTVAFATRAEVGPGELAVSVHGTPSGYAPGVTTDDVAAAIRNHPEYVPGQPICMYSCYAGANGTADDLAEVLGSPVRAPTSPVHLDPGASIPYLDPDGIWRTIG